MLCGVPVGAASVDADGRALDENGEVLSKNALKKLAKQAAVAAKKAEKAAAKAAAAEQSGAEASAGGEGGEEVEEAAAAYSFTRLGVLMSSATPEEQRRVYTPIKVLGSPSCEAAGQEVWVRGRLATLRASSSNCFVVLRAQGQYTVQAVFFKDKATPKQSKAMLASLGAMTEESIVDVRGRLVEAKVSEWPAHPPVHTPAQPLFTPLLTPLFTPCGRLVEAKVSEWRAGGGRMGRIPARARSFAPACRPTARTSRLPRVCATDARASSLGLVSHPGERLLSIDGRAGD
jgi:hypothetical protein